MKFTKRHFIYLIIIVGIAFFLSAYRLPYYIYKPGSADALAPIVHVENGHESKGDMHLVTVRGGQATPIEYLWAKILPHEEIHPIDKIRPKGMSQDEYFNIQLQMMSSSQRNAVMVAFHAAHKKVTITNDGVFVVGIVDGMPADGKLEVGDHITGIDGHDIHKAEDLMQYVKDKHAGDTIKLDIARGKQTLTKNIKLVPFKDQKDTIGIGIRLVTSQGVKTDPKVTFQSGNIGGPSAGLMFSLKIYDQLVKEDLTHGYQICGTGEIDPDGNVERIGGIDKKVVAADKEGCKIFFAPNEHGAKDSNYHVAKKTADEIGTDMKIVPVDTFNDALTYLENMK